MPGAGKSEALGVATADDLIDYFRLPKTEARPLITAMAEDGMLIPVTVTGWDRPAYTLPDLRRSKGVPDLRLLSPFDSLIFFRPRALRAFGFDYRMEFYVPADKRRFGYYVMPMLWGDRLIGRVDVRADRANGILTVPAAYTEPGEPESPLAEVLATSLIQLATWQGLEQVMAQGTSSFDKALAQHLPK